MAGSSDAFGCSTFPAHQVVEAARTAERRGLGRFVTEQPPYSLLARGVEADLALAFVLQHPAVTTPIIEHIGTKHSPCPAEAARPLCPLPSKLQASLLEVG